MQYLDELNEAQRVAVVNTEGPAMVIAGAGSGKTRVLTYRIAHLIHKGVDPFEILSLTFTNKAAREMKERIGKIVGGREAQNIWMGTFHSVFARILRMECEKIGYPSNFTIYDTQDSKSLLRNIIKEMGLDDKVYKVSMVYGRISSAKNNLISPTAYANNPELMSDDKMSGKPRLVEIYNHYVNRCFKAGAMDFDDLLYKTNVLFRDHLDVLHKYQHRFRYLLVDEYQDTNYSQYLIVKKLAAVNENICVVGDDAQSIYAFRGANIQNILNFKKDYTDYNLYKLEQNYRSTKTIVEAANCVIAKNRDQIQKNVWTSNDEGEKIKVHQALTDNEEGKIVAGSIFETKSNEKASAKDFAILYRTNAQSRAMEEALRKIDIPYRIYGGLSFYQRKEIKDLLAYIRLAVNPSDEEALRRVINYPMRGIGKTSLERITVATEQYGASFWEVISRLDKHPIKIGSSTKGKIEGFVTMVKSFSAMINTSNAFELGKHIASTTGILKELYADKSPEGVSRHENIEELLNAMKEFADQVNEENPEQPRTVADFLQDVALLTDQDNDKEDDIERVSMMTIHMAKGLEFPYVYIVGLEENLFPSQLSVNSRTELEEERRLFLRGFDPCRKNAVRLLMQIRGYRWGNLISCESSRFIDEIDPQYLEMPTRRSADPRQHVGNGDFGSYHKRTAGPTSYSKNNVPPASVSKSQVKSPLGRNLKRMSTAKAAVDSNFVGDDPSKIQTGMQVEHMRFGVGKVIHIQDGKSYSSVPFGWSKTTLVEVRQT